MDGKLVAIFALILSSSLFPALVSVPTRPQHLQSSPELCWQRKPVMVACFIWCVSVLYQDCALSTYHGADWQTAEDIYSGPARVVTPRWPPQYSCGYQ